MQFSVGACVDAFLDSALPCRMRKLDGERRHMQPHACPSIIFSPLPSLCLQIAARVAVQPRHPLPPLPLPLPLPLSLPLQHPHMFWAATSGRKREATSAVFGSCLGEGGAPGSAARSAAGKRKHENS
jgi:hypothetical protein